MVSQVETELECTNHHYLHHSPQLVGTMMEEQNGNNNNQPSSSSSSTTNSLPTTTTVSDDNDNNNNNNDSCYYSCNNNNRTDPKQYLNLQALDGIRCLTCLGVVMVHVYFITGAPLLLRESSCFASISQIPILPLFTFRITWHMTIFWILSGFLCEYQLYTLYTTKLVVQQQQQQQQQAITSESQPLLTTNGNNRSNNEFVTKQQQQQLQEQNGTVTSLTITTEISISWKEFVVFGMNRILRLYPLYIIIPTLVFISFQTNPNVQLSDIFPFHEYLATIFFFKTWTTDYMCGVWSVQVDMHGYFVLTILFAISYKLTYSKVLTASTIEERSKATLPKRILLLSWYILSLIHVIISYRPFMSQNISKEAAEYANRYGPVGIDTISDKQLRVFGIARYGGRESLYPNFNFSTNEESRTMFLRSMDDTYFGSIFNHGSAMMLGSLLFINLYQRQWQPSYPLLKLLFSFVFLIVTSGWHIFSGIASYFLIEAIVTLKISNNNSEQKKLTNNNRTRLSNLLKKSILQFLTNPFFQFLAPYTYGLYLFHDTPLFVIMEQYVPDKIRAIQNGAMNNIDSCQALSDAGYPFNLVFLIKYTILTFVIGLLISILMNRIIEQPIVWIRKVWLPKHLYNSNNNNKTCNSSKKKIL